MGTGSRSGSISAASVVQGRACSGSVSFPPPRCDVLDIIHKLMLRHIATRSTAFCHSRSRFDASGGIHLPEARSDYSQSGDSISTIIRSICQLTITQMLSTPAHSCTLLGRQSEMTRGCMCEMVRKLALCCDLLHNHCSHDPATLHTTLPTFARHSAV